MRKEIHLILLSCLISLPIYAQKVASDKVVTQVWNENTFMSDRSLLKNIEEVAALKSMLALLVRADIDILSNSETRLSVFIPLDSSLDRMKRKDRKSLVEKTTDEELKAHLKNFIVPGRLDSHSIRRNIENNNNAPVVVLTLGDKHLEFSLENDQLLLKDQNGNQAKWVEGDFYYKNGFFHFIDLSIVLEK